MTAYFDVHRLTRGAVFGALCLALAGCLLSPGKFVSQLDIRKDRSFSFTYTGEIHLLALSKLAEMGNDSTFRPQPCTQANSAAVRTCTAAEIAEQKRKWQEERTAGSQKRMRDAESMKAILGGIDPSDPRAAEELATRLRRQAGWRAVRYKGDGLFDVDFAINGKLDHDFVFPTIERFTMANAFVQVAVRSDDTIRIDAPGYAAALSGEPWRSMMSAAAASDGKANAPNFPTIDGHFTIRTDGAVLANNTDNGPQADPAGQRLDYTITPRSAGVPMALIRITR